MRSYSFFSFFSWFLLVGCAAQAQTGVSVTVPTQETLVIVIPADEYVTDVAVFYEELAPYGVWVAHPDHGQVFMPSDTAYTPYAQGRWDYTDQGYVWVSAEPFAWAVYHYGTWLNWGRWVWVPDTQWAPSWVEWRLGDGVVGWAPAAPRGVSVAVSDWRFCAVGSLLGDELAASYLPYGDALQVYPHSTLVTRRAGSRGGRTWAAGPHRRTLVQQGHPVVRLPPPERRGRGPVHVRPARPARPTQPAARARQPAPWRAQAVAASQRPARRLVTPRPGGAVSIDPRPTPRASAPARPVPPPARSMVPATPRPVVLSAVAERDAEHALERQALGRETERRARFQQAQERQVAQERQLAEQRRRGVQRQLAERQLEQRRHIEQRQVTQQRQVAQRQVAQRQVAQRQAVQQRQLAQQVQRQRGLELQAQRQQAQQRQVAAQRQLAQQAQVAQRQAAQRQLAQQAQVAQRQVAQRQVAQRQAAQQRQQAQQRADQRRAQQAARAQAEQQRRAAARQRAEQDARRQALVQRRVVAQRPTVRLR